MNALTDKRAADVAWARPQNLGDVVDLILGYSGPAYPGVDWIKFWAKPFLLGFESATTRAYAGYDAGREDAAQLISVARTIPGYVESKCGFWFCAADANSSPSWALGPISDYGRGFRDETLAQVGLVPLVPYGNPDARRAACAGAGAPNVPWGIGTWGEGEDGYGHAPAFSECGLVQSGNNAGPADGTDLDWIYVDLVEFAAYGGPTAITPVPARTEESEMEVVVVPAFGGGHVARLVLGSGFKLAEWRSDGTPATEFYGVPLGVADAPKGAPVRVITDVAQAVAFLHASDVATTGGVPIDVAALSSAIAAALPTTSKLDPAKLAADIASHLTVTSV